ncbi:hypothetical protein BC829DRAFT_169668 [Chytridium lagenaria]|nr:hypothetical protein BC829DRAFT_169668 [Chytridium lagenaria]
MQLQGSTSAGFTLASAITAMITGDTDWSYPALSGMALYAWSLAFSEPLRERILALQTTAEPAELNALLTTYTRRQWVSHLPRYGYVWRHPLQAPHWQRPSLKFLALYGRVYSFLLLNKHFLSLEPCKIR